MMGYRPYKTSINFAIGIGTGMLAAGVTGLFPMLGVIIVGGLAALFLEQFGKDG